MEGTAWAVSSCSEAFRDSTQCRSSPSFVTSNRATALLSVELTEWTVRWLDSLCEAQQLLHPSRQAWSAWQVRWQLAYYFGWMWVTWFRGSGMESHKPQCLKGPLPVCLKDVAARHHNPSGHDVAARGVFIEAGGRGYKPTRHVWHRAMVTSVLLQRY